MRIGEQSDPHVTFKALVGDLDNFLNVYRHRKPFLRRGISRAVGITHRDLEKLLMTGGLREPYLQVIRDGRSLDASVHFEDMPVQKARVRGRVNIASIGREIDTGATVTMSGLDHHIPELQLLCGHIGTELGGAVGCAASLTKGHYKSANLWHENAELLVVQLHGTTHWTIYPQMRPLPRRTAELCHGPSETAAPSALSVAPGDCLYIPWGAPFHMEAADNSLSCHLTIVCKPRTHGDVLSEFIGALAEQETGFPKVAMATGATLTAELQSRLSSLLARCTEEGLLAHVRTRSGQHTSIPARRGFLLQEARRRDINLDSRVSRHFSVDCTTKLESEGQIYIRSGTRTFKYPGIAASTVRAIDKLVNIRIRDIPTEMKPTQLLRMIDHLVAIGVLYID